RAGTSGSRATGRMAGGFPERCSGRGASSKALVANRRLQGYRLPAGGDKGTAAGSRLLATGYRRPATGGTATGCRLSTPAENLTDPPIENLTGRRGDEPQFVGAS